MRNSKREFISLAVAFAIILMLVANMFQGRILATADDDVYESLEIFSMALDIVQKEYVSEVSSDTLIRGALYGMLGSLDQHSAYMTRGSHTRLMDETRGEYEGVGIQLQVPKRPWAPISPGNPLVVRKVFPGTPAFRSDIMEGDAIIKVGGETTEEMSIDDAVDKIKGPRGTKVTLTMQRIVGESGEDARTSEFDVELERAKIPLLSVPHAEMSDDGIGYIRLADFKESSADELTSKITELKAKGMKALVLDLRYNPGGLLSTAVDVADLFLPKGAAIVSTKKEREPDQRMTYTSNREPLLTKKECPMAVLVNTDSASGSEIVTSALQDHNRAIVVGMTTYGKSSVQMVSPLPGESALKITTAYYYTPREKRLSGVGVQPDIPVILPEKDYYALRRQLPDDRDVVSGEAVSPDSPEEKVDDIQLKEAETVLRGYVILASQENPGDEQETITAEETM
jgi:carboxyl-terminal processing protease